MMNEQLKAIYFDPKNKGSFGGPSRLSDVASVRRSVAKTFLEQQEAYTVNKNVRHKLIRRKITSHKIDYLWQADLIILSKFGRVNKGYNHILTVIDVASRYAFARAIKNKTAGVVTEAFTDIVLSSKRKCKYLQCDEGTEFFNRKFKAYLQSQSIKLFHNHSPLKAAMIERFNRTLMTRLQKVFTFRKSKVYLDVLEDVIKSYNSSEHRIIGCSPDSVNKFNQMDVWFKSNKDLIQRKKASPKYKIGDIVRIKICKEKFDKGYTEKFTTELYKVCQVNNSKPITYNIADNTNETIKGIFYAGELSRVQI
jgi:hypothetical protein